MRKKNITKILLFAFLILTLAGCAGKKVKTYADFNKYYEKGLSAYEKGKWTKSIDNFKLFLINSPGNEFADKAQFYIGEAYFNRKEYLLGISEYKQLVQRYRYSPLGEEGYYKIALCYFELSPKYQLEQPNTDRALIQLQEFIDNYPESKFVPEATENIGILRNKLAKKMYESGKLYRKLKQYNSSIIYIDKMLAKYYDSDWVSDAKYEKAYCYIKLRTFDDYQVMFDDIADDNIEQSKKDELVNKLEDKFTTEKNKIQKEEQKRKSEKKRRKFWF